MKCTRFIGSLFGLLLSNGAVVSAIHHNNNKSKRSTTTILRRRQQPQFGIRSDYYTSRFANKAVQLSSSSTTTLFHDDGNGKIATSCRGGACSDSTPALFAKVALSASVETGLMYALVKYAVKINTSKDFTTTVTRVVQAGILLVIIFGSATFGSIIDNGMSAATKQLLDPNTVPGDGDWYNWLKKPSWNPPGWLFPIMWLIVSKPTQFAAVWKLITQTTNTNALSIPLLVYCTHLSLGDAWNKVFFGLECTGRGLAVITAFWTVLWLSAYLFYKVDPVAGYLLLPTCGWVSVAASLNLSIYLLNKDDEGGDCS